MEKNKCYGCEKRYVGCHATCEDYKEFLIRNEARKERIKKEGEIRRISFDSMDAALHRSKQGRYKK